MSSAAVSKIALIRKALQPRAPWLSAFAPSLDTKVRARVSQVSQVDINAYEPQQVESLLNDVAQRLDAALAHRRDAIDLDILALKHAMDFELYLRTSPIDLGIAQAGIADVQAQIQAAANRNASDLLANAGGNDALAQPLSVQADGIAKAAEVSVAREQDRWRLINDRSDLQSQFQLDWNDRHNDPGGAHNFAERYTRVVDLLLEDVEEAYVKLSAAQLGLDAVFDIQVAVPDPAAVGTSLLDELVRCNRTCAREYDVVTRREVEHRFIAAAVSGTSESDRPFCSRATFDAHMVPAGDGEVSFDLSGVFARFKSSRIKSVGLSTKFDLPGDLTTRDYRRLSRADCVVYPPQQANRRGAYERGPLFFGSVGSEYSDVPSVLTGRTVENLDPDGVWKVAVSPHLMGPDSTSSPRGTPLLTDIVLHLNLAVLTR